jgi:hypothetical protein
MYSVYVNQELPWLGFPIRTSTDQSALTAPRGFSQLCHVLHRLSLSRHPPIALNNLRSNQDRRHYCIHNNEYQTLNLPTGVKISYF